MVAWIDAIPGTRVDVGTSVVLRGQGEAIHWSPDCERAVRPLGNPRGRWWLTFQLPGGQQDDASSLLSAPDSFASSFVASEDGVYRALFSVDSNEGGATATAVVYAGASDVWVEQGPGPGFFDDPGYKKVSGAIAAVAPDPHTTDRVFVAAVGGGVWLSTNAVSATDPSWIPLTDSMPSLSMSAIAFSPLDPDRNTLYAGCGAVSHGLAPGPLSGLFRTTDGGRTWLEVGSEIFQGRTVTRILPTEIVNLGPLPPPRPFAAAGAEPVQVLLVSTIGGGLLRSSDTGISWTQVPTVGDDVTDVAVDASDPRRVYAAGLAGVYRTDDAGDPAGPWTNVTGPLGEFRGRTVRLSVSPVTDRGRPHRLYASVGGNLFFGDLYGAGLFFTDDGGEQWQDMGVPPDGSKPTCLLAASPMQRDVVFVGSDSGHLWMARSGPWAPPATLWAQVDYPAIATAPHTDGRDFAFSADPNILLLGSDGGIYRLINAHDFPGGPGRHWEEAVGDIRVTEFYAVAYDSVNHVIFGATQDNAIPQQTAPGLIAWGANEASYGDGVEVGVDNSTHAPLASIHYSSQQKLSDFRRRVYRSPTQVTDKAVLVVIEGTGGLQLSDFEGNLPHGSTIQWRQTWALNEADPTRLLLGTDFLYESDASTGSDGIESITFRSLGGRTRSTNGQWIPTNPVGTVTAYAYGHLNNPDVIYVGCGGKLWLRARGLSLPGTVHTYMGSTPTGVALAPSTWRRAYVLDGQGCVWVTEDAGATASGWTDITRNLSSFTSDLRTITMLAGRFVDDTVLVGGYGGVYACTRSGATSQFDTWHKVGRGLPNAVVTSIMHSADDDLLLAGTNGRASWTLAKVSELFPPPGRSCWPPAEAIAGALLLLKARRHRRTLAKVD